MKNLRFMGVKSAMDSPREYKKEFEDQIYEEGVDNQILHVYDNVRKLSNQVPGEITNSLYVGLSKQTKVRLSTQLPNGLKGGFVPLSQPIAKQTLISPLTR